MITLYGFSRVTPFAHGRTRDLRILWALEEMELPYEVKGLDHPAGELNTEAYRSISPFEQIPAINDGGTIVSESAAILLYLARKTGKLIPSDARGQAQVERWCIAAINTVELPMTFLDVLKIGASSGAPVDQLRKTTLELAHKRLQRLSQWMQGRAFIAADQFTVADILMAHVLSEQGDDVALFDPYPVLVDYRERCQSRSAWRKALHDYCTRVESVPVKAST